MKMVDGYFKWLTNKVSLDDSPMQDDILKALYKIDFEPIRPMDENLAVQGAGLRDNYVNEERAYHLLPSLSGPCSILEMMVSLSEDLANGLLYRKEESEEITVKEIFWTMALNLGIDPYVGITNENLMHLTNLKSDIDEDGAGGFFYMPGCPIDLRKEDIWTQANLFIQDYDFVRIQED